MSFVNNIGYVIAIMVIFVIMGGFMGLINTLVS